MKHVWGWRRFQHIGAQFHLLLIFNIVLDLQLEYSFKIQ